MIYKLLGCRQSSIMSKQTKIWVDGCFDVFHYGHMNALRQASLMGDFLVVGVHSDENIEKNKGPTVLKNKERYDAVRACKYVDLVVEDAPYLTQLSFLDRYDCDFCVHGDDITTMSDGTDCYGLVKREGRYKECKRTEGVSTTDLVSRMLKRKFSVVGERPDSSSYQTSEKLALFSNNCKAKATDSIIYVDGSFDSTLQSNDSVPCWSCIIPRNSEENGKLSNCRNTL